MGKVLVLLSLLFGLSAEAAVMNCSKSPIKMEPVQVDIRGKTAVYEGLVWKVASRSNVITSEKTGRRYFLIKLHRSDVFWGPGFMCFVGGDL